MDKCLFLLTRSLREHDTSEGLAYTVVRAAKRMGFGEEYGGDGTGEVHKRCSELAFPLYETAVATVGIHVYTFGVCLFYYYFILFFSLN